MLFAMCADTGMIISFLFLMLIAGLIAGLVLIGLTVLACMGVAKILDAWKGHETISEFPQSVP